MHSNSSNSSETLKVGSEILYGNNIIYIYIPCIYIFHLIRSLRKERALTTFSYNYKIGL